MIKDLHIGDILRGEVFYCTGKVSGISSKGDTYYTVTLQDATGIITAKIWQMGDGIEDFSAKMFVSIEGRVTSYNDAPQINITGCSVVDPSMVNMSDYCPKSPINLDEMTKTLMDYIESIKNPFLKQLLENFYKNNDFMNIFIKCSAAKTVHHAYIGGLLEHTIAVASICEHLAQQYPKINRDLLITAALFHDIGKVKEFSPFPENDYTDVGNLLGHIYMGTEMIDKSARRIEGFPKNLLNELKHCIIAHHGEQQFGSPKNPALIEALALSFADDTDAKLRRFSDLLEDNDGEWSDKSDFFLNSKYRKTML